MKSIAVFAVALLVLFVSCKKNGVGPGSPLIQKIIFSSLTPDSGAYKDSVTIIGKDLISPDSIKLNGKLCPIITSDSDTIIVTVPRAAGTGPVVMYFKDTTITGPIFHFRYTSYVTTIAYCKNISNANAAGPDAGFIWPYGVAMDASGNIYVAGYSYTPYIRKIDTSGIFTAYAGNGQFGFTNSTLLQSEWGLGQDFIAIDGNGNLAVTDVGYRIRKIGIDGMVSNYVGDGAFGIVNGAADTSEISGGGAVAFNSKGELYFTDIGYVRKVSLNGMVSNYMGNGLTPDAYTSPAPAVLDTSTWLYGTSALCFDQHDNLYLADGPYICMTTPDGVVKIIAGRGDIVGNPLDGPALQAGLDGTYGITADSSGNIYFTDVANRIRELTTTGNVVTLAGSTAGFADGPVATALFNNPWGIIADKDGDLIIADNGNYRIRKLVIQ